MAEVIKYGIMWDARVFQRGLEDIMLRQLKALDNQALEYAIGRCCEIKAEVVAAG